VEGKPPGIAAEAEIERATAPHPGDEPSLCGD